MGRSGIKRNVLLLQSCTCGGQVLLVLELAKHIINLDSDRGLLGQVKTEFEAVGGDGVGVDHELAHQDFSCFLRLLLWALQDEVHGFFVFTLLDVVELQVAHDVGVALVFYHLQLGVFETKLHQAGFFINNTVYLGVFKDYLLVLYFCFEVDGVALLLQPDAGEFFAFWVNLYHKKNYNHFTDCSFFVCQSLRARVRNSRQRLNLILLAPAGGDY